MNINEYTKESERRIIRALQDENEMLRAMLRRKGITVPESRAFKDISRNDEEFDSDQGGRILSRYITDDMAKVFFLYFWGRMDVYAVRGKNGGYFPKCKNAFKAGCPKKENPKISCKDCEHKEWLPLGISAIKNHLIGKDEYCRDVVGVYPLHPDNTCRFLVFDFDNHEKGNEKNDFANSDDEWKDEVDALRTVLYRNDIDYLTERSKSGQGAHLWIFFKEPIDAGMARNFGKILLEKGYSLVNYRSFKYFDRMFPSQDYHDSEGLGNLVALPLQGQALKAGNSAFVDNTWNAYEDQWDKLFKTRRLEKQFLIDFIQKETEVKTAIGLNDISDRVKPLDSRETFHRDDVEGKINIVLADGLYVDSLNLKVRIQNQIRRLAVFNNPVFYKKKRMKQFTGYDFRTVYLGEDIDGYIHLPRGLKDELIKQCKSSDIECVIDDKREDGKPLRVKFKGELRFEQRVAAESLLQYDSGILNAATAFGKTVVCAYLIAKRKTNTLILIENTSLMQQWIETLEQFLDIDEMPPEYTTKTGRIKRRTSVIGTIKGGTDKLTGIIDVAMIGSLCSKGELNKRLSSYGMVIMDDYAIIGLTQESPEIKAFAA